MAENTSSASAAAGTVVSGSSIQGQVTAAVVTSLRDARAPAKLLIRSHAASVVMSQRRSLREGMRWCRMKFFGRGCKEQTMQRISSRKRISTSGLRDLKITVNV